MWEVAPTLLEWLFLCPKYRTASKYCRKPTSPRHRIRILYKHNPINNPLFENTFIRLLNLSHTSNRRRNTFTGLHDVARNTILDDSVREIVMMLEHNVLAKFKLSPGLKRLEQRELMEIGE